MEAIKQIEHEPQPRHVIMRTPVNRAISASPCTLTHGSGPPHAVKATVGRQATPGRRALALSYQPDLTLTLLLKGAEKERESALNLVGIAGDHIVSRILPMC